MSQANFDQGYLAGITYLTAIKQAAEQIAKAQAEPEMNVAVERYMAIGPFKDWFRVKTDPHFRAGFKKANQEMFDKQYNEIDSNISQISVAYSGLDEDSKAIVNMMTSFFDQVSAHVQDEIDEL